MIYNIFFYNKIDHTRLEIYDESFLAYIVSGLIGSARECNVDFIISRLEALYGNHSFSLGKIYAYLEKNYIRNKEEFSLKKSQTRAIKYVDELRHNLHNMEWMNEDILLKNLSNYIVDHNINYISGFKFLAALLKNNNLMNEDVLLSKFYNYIINYDKNYILVDKTINLIDDSYDNLPINFFIENKTLVQILFANGINYIWDLKQLSAASSTLLFCINLNDTIASLSSLSDDFNLIYKEKICNLFKSLPGKELDILDKRNGFASGHKMTLEEVGRLYNFTRERCRQIEVKATKKIIFNSNSIISILTNLYLSIFDSDNGYLCVDKLFSFVGNDLISRYIIFLYENLEIDIIYDADFKVLYNKTQTTIEEICNKVLGNFSDTIQVDDYNFLDAFQKTVINHSYKLFRNYVYLKKGLTVKDLIGKIIDETFQDGYRISNQDHYKKIKEIFIKKYGDSDEFPSEHSIQGFIDRLNYCQVNIGTYKNRAFCAVLSQDLIDDIINYILENAPTVFYSSIYENFKPRLEELNINNYFYLKGLIDPYLPNDFLTKRNYITIGKEKISSVQAITNYIKSFDGIFTLEDIRAKFKGIKDYTIYNVLYKEFELGLIDLSNRKFIYYTKVMIEKSVIDELKQFIDNLFTSLNTRIISSRKIYAKLALTNKELLSKLKIATDSYSTFSLIKYLFKNDYGFNRPLIALDKDSNVNCFGLFANYALTLDSFNHETIKLYANKMNIRSLYSYLEFMEGLSDDFVQISQDAMVSKRKINLSPATIQEIDQMLSLIFSRFKEIHLDKFNGYAMLPRLPYHWNKYLLAGIIRSYLSDKYETENTANSYDKTSFIIRKNDENCLIKKIF